MPRLSRYAWTTALFHAAGLAFAALGMRPGTPLVPLAERRAFLDGAHLGWSLGWTAWMVCALTLALFYFMVARREAAETEWPRFAFALTIAGIAVDLLCDALYIGLLPQLARGDERQFILVERLCTVGGAVVANGLYTIGAVIITFCRRRSPLVMALGAGVGICGAAMVVAGLDGVPQHLEIATGPTIGLFCLWSLALARELDQR